jgi:hypothetical protein
MTQGVFNFKTGTWASGQWRGPQVTDGYNPSPLTLCNSPEANVYRVHCLGAPCGLDGGNPDAAAAQPGNAAVLAYSMLGTGNRTSTGGVYMGSSLIFMYDRGDPKLSRPNVPSSWTGAGEISVKGTDYGLGMATLSASGNGFSRSLQDPCYLGPTYLTDNPGSANSGDRRHRCPKDLTLTIPVTDLPEGAYDLDITGKDVIERIGTDRISLKIDYTMPRPALGSDFPQVDPSPDGVEAYVRGGGTRKLQVSADDALSGIKRLALVELTGSGETAERHELSSTTVGCADDGTCPSSANLADYALDVGALSEGRYTYLSSATDAAGNANDSVPFDVLIDRTAPPAPAEIAGERFDSGTNSAVISWSQDDDPTLASGEDGSGVDRTEVRYRPSGTGPYTDWLTPQDPDGLTINNVTSGQQLDVEARTYDAAGNVSGVVTTTVTVGAPLLDDPIELVDYDVDDAGNPTGGSPTAVTASRPFPCVAGRTGQAPSLSDYANEPNTLVHTEMFFSCNDARGALGVQEMRLAVCIRMRGGADGGFHPQVCDRRQKDFSQGPVIGTLRVPLDLLCRPGTRDYHVTLEARLKYFLPDPTFPFRKTVRKRYTTPSASLNCNEAAAWRLRATHNFAGIKNRSQITAISSPSTMLGAALRRVGNIPPGNGSGWAAHHIIASSYKARAADAQRLGYICGIGPNTATNGVWLRGPSLRSDQPGYVNLPAAGKRRAYHPSIHSQTYFDAVADELEPLVTTQPDGRTTCDARAARTKLGYIALRLSYNDFPYQPGQQDAEEADD